MSRMAILVTSMTILAAMQGCATKTYGRQSTLTSFEKDSMTCREIDLDLAKTRGFVDRVTKESEFSGKDVLAFLGDFGIGNNMEKIAALESANNRIESLNDLLRTKKCAAVPASASAAVAAEAPASAASSSAPAQ